eukprot:GEMP01125273.1.p1 GENE.GEMP01125273.1~~GEMP01125273.1.p1  ORF type:complete len:171 (+),score=36.00 GEMP01125273.1:70-513(+)
MGKFIKPGRICVVLNGRMAGKKAVVVKQFDEGTRKRPFAHALVAGLERAPQKVTKSMSKKKISKRMRVKPFVRYVNYNHIMPTRYQVPSELDVKNFVTDSQMDNDDGRIEAKKALSSMLKEKFQTPVLDKNGKPSKDMLFLRRRLRF